MLHLGYLLEDVFAPVLAAWTKVSALLLLGVGFSELSIAGS